MMYMGGGAMGVKQFSKVFAKAMAPVDMGAVLAGKRVAIDMNLVLCKAIKAVVQMTDAQGVPTAGLNLMISLIGRLKKAGVARIIGIFDNPAPNPMKLAECQRRRECAEECKARAAEAQTSSEKEKLASRAWRMDEAVMRDAMQFMRLAGVECHVAPIGREAEQYAANLATAGAIDVVLTDDSDAVMFGAPVTLLMKAGAFIMVNLVDLLEKYGLTVEQFRHICIALGTDFAEKMPGVGQATAVTRGKNRRLNAEQAAAFAYVASGGGGRAEILAPSLDKAALIEWLVVAKGFNRARIAGSIDKL